MPIRPNSTEFAVQRNPGRIVIRDWASVGVAPYATMTPPQRFGPAVAVLPDGGVIDMTEPAERLGIENTGLNFRWAASPSGQVAVAADSTIEIWDPATGEFVRSVDKPVDCVVAVGWDIAFAGTADDGTVVVRCNGTLRAWDLASPDRARQWAVPIASQNYNARVRISPDRSRILVPADQLKLIDAETGDTVAEVAAGSVINDAYSPDGRLILAVDWPGDVQVFDADDLTLIKRLKPSGGAVNDGEGSPVLAVSPDNEYVAAWHDTIGVEMWNLESGDSLAVIDGRRDYRPDAPGERQTSIAAGPYTIYFPLAALRFDEDGTALDLTVVQSFTTEGPAWYHRSLDTNWSLQADDLIGTACRLAGRELTEDEWAKYIGDSVPYRATCSTA
jgi:WD40 repeat protein